MPIDEEKKDLTEINIETVRDLKRRGLYDEAEAMIKEHQRQFKEGMIYVRKRKVTDKEKIKRFRLRRDGICISCTKNPIAEGNKNLCTRCLKRKRDYYRNNKLARTIKNCATCPAELKNHNSKYCPDCKNDIYNILTAKGICYSCRNRPADKPRKTCNYCRERDRARDRERRAERRREEQE